MPETSKKTIMMRGSNLQKTVMFQGSTKNLIHLKNLKTTGLELYEP
jgi:hypothetical protein